MTEVRSAPISPSCLRSSRGTSISAEPKSTIPSRSVNSESPNKKNIAAISSKRNMPWVSGECSYSLPIAIR